MPIYQQTIGITDPAHSDRPPPPLHFQFCAKDDASAREIAVAHRTKIEAAPAVDGIHYEKLEEGTVNRDMFVPIRVVFREHDDEACGDLFCSGFSEEVRRKKFEFD